MFSAVFFFPKAANISGKYYLFSGRVRNPFALSGSGPDRGDDAPNVTHLKESLTPEVELASV